MINAALALFQARGPAATGFSDIIDASGAPRGSIYHHFPGGKAQLLEAAIDRAADAVATLIRMKAAGAPSPADVVHAIAEVFIAAPLAANWTLGCPVAATASEGDTQPESVRAAVARAFSLWIETVSGALRAAGLSEEDSVGFAPAVVCGLEGGLIVARGLRDRAAFDAIVEALANEARRRRTTG